MKLCKDCVHYQPDNLPSLATCDRPEAVNVNPVTGERSQAYCLIERTGISGCGAEAKHFEPREAQEAA